MRLNKNHAKILLIIFAIYVACSLALSFYIFNLAVSNYANHYTQAKKYESIYSIFKEIFFAFFVYLWRWIKDNPEPITALATVVIGWFTYVLAQANRELIGFAAAQSRDTIESLRISNEAANATKKSVELAKMGFTAVHRPKIHLRRLVMEEITDEKLSIKALFVNIGASEAFIYERNLTIFSVHDKALPADPPYHTGVTAYDHIGVHPGQHQPFITSFENAKTGDTLVDSLPRLFIELGKRNFYVIGYIEYKDAIGTVRTTAFCRLFNVATKRFSKIEDPEYEYED